MGISFYTFQQISYMADRMKGKADHYGLLDYMIVPKAPLGKLLPEVPRLFAGTAHESDLIRSGRCTTLLVAPLDESSADLIEFDGEVEGRLPLDLSFTGHTINVLRG